MTWFSIKHNGDIKYCYATSEQNLLFHYAALGIWNIKCETYTPTLFNYKTLLAFFNELQNALSNGLQLNEAILNLSDSTTKTNLAKNCLAITHELNAGKSFNKTLSRLSNNRCQPYCQLIISDGSREDCEKSLEISIMQLQTLLGWSEKLLKGISYPFFIVQVALLINLMHSFFIKQDLLINAATYLFTSLLQGLVVISFVNGSASDGFESLNRSFRLTKLLALLNASRKTGKSLQNALLAMPQYFSHEGLKKDIISAYYALLLGKSYQASFPEYWFPKKASLALHSANKSGDIDRALTLAAREHEKQCQRTIYWFEKIIPAGCLFIAGGFVVSALLSIYKPLLELP